MQSFVIDKNTTDSAKRLNVNSQKTMQTALRILFLIHKKPSDRDESFVPTDHKTLLTAPRVSYRVTRLNILFPKKWRIL